jgi:hypothetical protein
VIFGKPDRSDERAFFLLAERRNAASKRATAVLAARFDVDPPEVHLYNFTSFADLINSGVSDDEDIRVFEIGWKGQRSARGPNTTVLD